MLKLKGDTHLVQKKKELSLPSRGMTYNEQMCGKTGCTLIHRTYFPCALQAPSNMKSVLQAGWLLTVAVGNIVVLIISEAATLSEQVGGFYFTSSRCIVS